MKLEDIKDYQINLTFYECEQSIKVIDFIKLIKDESIESKYKKSIAFIKTISDESIYDTYENLNELNWSAFELLQELGEI